MGFIAQQDPSTGNAPRQKVKGPKCGQCEEKKAAVVSIAFMLVVVILRSKQIVKEAFLTVLVKHCSVPILCFLFYSSF